MVLAAIAIGSNLGQRAKHIEVARQALAALPRTQLIAFSSSHETAAVGPGAQGQYLNAAAVIETAMSPRDLLNHLLRIEQTAGRVRGEKWGPRTLDLDLLLYGDQVIDEPGLKVPHPHMHERRFVLDPLAEIAPEMVHPVLRQTVKQLRETLLP